MRALLDTNVILDVLLSRQPWVKDSASVWQLNDEGQIEGYVVATTLTDIFYITRRMSDRDTASQAIDICLSAFEICIVDRQALQRARELPGDDFEDNLQIACAESAKLEAIVTRNKPDFAASPVPVFTPLEFLAQLPS